MNMISTGAFQTEMDASNKQSTIAEKFAAVWEKKNAKAARAGGVSLMALSLAACGSSDDDTSTDTTSDTTLKTFQPNEQLLAENEITFGTTLIEVGSPFGQLLPVDSSAVASVAYINAGVYFIRGHFVDIPSSYLILDQYTNTPSYRVGLEVSESIVTPEDDPNLNDNAAGTSNYSAPGSHRFRIKTSLVKKAINDTTDKNFIELLRLNNSKVEEFVTATAYSELEKSLARRTFEESGD